VSGLDFMHNTSKVRLVMNVLRGSNHAGDLYIRDVHMSFLPDVGDTVQLFREDVPYELEQAVWQRWWTFNGQVILDLKRMRIDPPDGVDGQKWPYPRNESVWWTEREGPFPAGALLGCGWTKS
jgi:hypothetical protein